MGTPGLTGRRDVVRVVFSGSLWLGNCQQLGLEQALEEGGQTGVSVVQVE